MKRSIFFVLSTAAVLFIASCNKNAVNPEETPGGAPESFEAYIDENPATKMALDTANLTFAWDVNDQIAVNGAVYQREGTTNTFKYYSGRYVSSNPQLGCYPASLYDEQTTAEQGKPAYDLPDLYSIENSDSPVNYVPMAGLVTEGSKIYFTHLCAVVRVNLRVNDASNSLTKVSLICEDGTTYLSGKITAVFDKEGNREVKMVEGRDVVAVGLNNPKEMSQSETVSLYLPVFLFNDTPSLTGVEKTFAANTLRLKIEGLKDGKYAFCDKTIDREITMKRGELITINTEVTFSQSSLSGAGTVSDPFLIKNENDFYTWVSEASSDAMISKMATSYFKLQPEDGTTEITIRPQLNTPIGGNMDSYYFKDGLKPGKGVFGGVLDGNGCTLNIQGTNDCPLFFAMSGAVIKDLILKVSGITQSSRSTSATETLNPFAYYSEKTYFVSVYLNVSRISASVVSKLSAFGAAVNGSKIIGSFEKISKIEHVKTVSITNKYYFLYSEFSPSHPGVDYADCWDVYGVNETSPIVQTIKIHANGEGVVTNKYSFSANYATEVGKMQTASKKWKDTVRDSTGLTQDAKTRLTPNYMLKYESGFKLTQIQ